MKNILIFLILIFSVIPVFGSSNLPGDANSDGHVDGIDYVIWLNNYNKHISGINKGDFDNNGFVDGLDYVIWLNNYGKAAQLSPTPTVTSIPSAGSCLARSSPFLTLNGTQVNRYDTRSNLVPENTVIDARSAVWTALWPVQDSFNYPVLISGGPNLCFTGGSIQGSYPEQINSDPNLTWEYMHGTTAMKIYAKNTTVQNTFINNY